MREENKAMHLLAASGMVWEEERGIERKKENTTQAESQSESTTQSKPDVKREHIQEGRKKKR